MEIRLHNTLTREVEPFVPLDPKHVKMYVCGPTVYARPHLGNARSVVVYDVLYRLLKHDFPKVTYARNITDVDDKINAAAVERGISIQALTKEVAQQFHEDMDALSVLRPTVEPRATEYIGEMIAMITQLIESGHAYEAKGHVLFAVASDTKYGQLARRSRDEMLAGARVEVAPYKQDPGDFVLWKPASVKDDPSSKFESPWGVGRPGWHIECSSMATSLLGVDFDIHGGGADLMFPHHENEIAQSTCAHPQSHYAKYWVHNGFLTVNGEKMAKSVGNFITVHDLLSKGVRPEDIRFALLSTRYSEPLNWTEKLLEDSKRVNEKLYRRVGGHEADGEVNTEVLEALRDNLNTPKAIAILQTLSSAELKTTANFLGLLRQTEEERFQSYALYAEPGHYGMVGTSAELAVGVSKEVIERKIQERAEAKQSRDFKTADTIRDELKAKGIVLEDSATGTTWRKA